MISSFYEKIVGTSPPPESNLPKILCVGLACLDIVQVCKHYPAEDSDQRCVDYRWQRGGNACNNCTVLAILNSPCEFLGCLSSVEHLNFLQNDMKKYKIDFSHCRMINDVGCPMSTVILSLSSGTRTILHFNPNLPEIRLEDFEKLNLDDYSWIHFEGRNTTEVLSMMQHIENYNKSLLSGKKSSSNHDTEEKFPITISVELEKPRQELLDLLPYTDVAFIAKNFAQSRGFDNMSETLKNISQEAKSGATIICAWGDRGAMAKTPDGTTVQSPAFPPNKIVDTLGAGDTFNAAVLYCLNKAKLAYIKKSRKGQMENTATRSTDAGSVRKMSEVRQNVNIESSEFSQTQFIDEKILHYSITFGCRIAGAKIGQKGYDDFEKVVEDFMRSDLMEVN